MINTIQLRLQCYDTEMKRIKTTITTTTIVMELLNWQGSFDGRRCSVMLFIQYIKNRQKQHNENQIYS